MTADKLCNNMPELVKLNNNETWNEYLDKLYAIYLNDFFHNDISFEGKIVKTFTQLEYNMKQQSFNHITTKGSNNRLYNEKRCQRIKWIKPLIEGSCKSCKYYRRFPDFMGNNKKRVILWCEHCNFIVILEERKSNYVLISAYCIVYDKKRRELEKKYDRHLEAKTKSARR